MSDGDQLIPATAHPHLFSIPDLAESICLIPYPPEFILPFFMVGVQERIRKALLFIDQII